MEILIPERTDITPLVGMDWMKTFKLIIERIQLSESNQSEREKIFGKFQGLFENNETIKDTEINIQLKPGHYPIKQKARPVPIHLQEDVERELKKLIRTGHLEKTNDLDEDCFVSPVVITVKSDKSVKIALDSRKLNDSFIKMRPHMPNMEELLNQISLEITRDRTAQLFMSKIDLDYKYGQIKLSEETSRQCVFALTGGNFSGYYRFKKGFYGLADMPTIFQEKIDRTLEYCTPAWLDDIIIVTRGSKQDHEKKLFDVLDKLEKAGYRASKKKSEFFMKETKWLGHEINENGIKPNDEKVEAILKLKPPENTKDLKSFIGAIQYMAKFLPKFSEQTDRLRKLLKKNEPWIWGPEQETDFNRIKQMLTEGPCLAHYAKDKDNMVDLSKTTWPIVDLSKFNTEGKEAHYIQINHIVGKLSGNKKITEDTIKKAEFEFMMDLKTLIARTAIDPELTRVRISMRREDREATPEGYKQENSQSDGDSFLWTTRS